MESRQRLPSCYYQYCLFAVLEITAENDCWHLRLTIRLLQTKGKPNFAVAKTHLEVSFFVVVLLCPINGSINHCLYIFFIVHTLFADQNHFDIHMLYYTVIKET